MHNQLRRSSISWSKCQGKSNLVTRYPFCESVARTFCSSNSSIKLNYSGEKYGSVATHCAPIHSAIHSVNSFEDTSQICSAHFNKTLVTDIALNPMKGFGKSVFGNGYVYMGKFRDGVWHGKGSIDFGGGKTFLGRFRAGSVVKGEGQYVFENGEVFDGALVNGKMYGPGVLRAVDGTSYESTWLGGRMHGACTVKYPTGESFVGCHSSALPQKGYGWHVNSDGALYEGVWSEGLYHGHGTLYGVDGSILQGRWVQGQLQGRGVVVRNDGEVISGLWRNGTFKREPHARNTAKKASTPAASVDDASPTTPTIRYPDGMTYTGDMRNNLRHGFGTFTYTDGSVYEGQFNNNTMQGHGTYTNSKSGIVYTGQFENNVKHGEGMLLFPSGEMFRGEFRHNRIHSGEGTYVYNYGSTYTGTYSDGMRHGAGILRERNGSSLEGTFVNNRPHGQAVYTSPEGQVIRELWDMGQLVKQGPVSTSFSSSASSSSARLLKSAVTLHFEDDSVYTGECVKGIPHGHGRVKYPNGSEYIGEFRRAHKHGHGKQRYVEYGCTYEGAWEHGNKHGEGKLHYYDSDESFTGVFNKGKVHSGEGVYYSPDSIQYSGVFAHGYLTQGSVLYEDGRLYEGTLIDGLHHGQGKLTDSKGAVVHEGQWEEGYPITK